MTELLESAIFQLKALPYEEQNAIAAIILEELKEETLWEEAFSHTPDVLAKHAATAMVEYRD